MNHTGGVWRMVTAMVMSGTIGVFVLMSGQSPLTVVFFRCLLGATALLGYLAWRGGWKRLDVRAALWVAGGAAALIVNWLCLFSAFSVSGIAITTVVYHVQPFLLLVLSALIERELPGWRKLPWLLLAFIGVALTTGVDLTTQHSALAGGVLLALAAAFLYALATLATRKLAAYAPAQIAGLQLAIGALVLAPMVNFKLREFGWGAWTSLLVLGLLHTGLMYNLMYGAFQRLRADVLATLSFIYPAVAVLADLLLFDATLAPLQWLGMGLILSSVLANQRTPARVAAVPLEAARHARPAAAGSAASTEHGIAPARRA
jgi:drug/metabolite transporter (DMT)-like permease